MLRNTKLLLSILLCLFLGVSLSGCSATRLENVWKDDAYTEKLGSVLILGVTKNRSVRQVYEGELARQLQARGVQATPSFTLLPDEAPADKQAILRQAQKHRAGHVIVTQLLDVKTYRERITDINRLSYPDHYLYSRYYRTYRRPIGWYDSYWNGYTTVRSYDVEYYVAHAETSVYSLQGEKLIWSVLSETESGREWAAGARDLAQAIVQQLEQDGML